MNNNGALAGITVLDLSRLLPGPYCSMILADHGARVISVEDKRFQADGLFLDSVNRNKEHMSLNLKTAEGKEIFFQLVKKSDILIESFRPGVVERLGVDYESVKAVNSGVIYCAITGYGQTGPYKDRAGHDANYLSVAGVLDLNGSPDQPPSIPGVQVADIAGGSMNAVIGILLALQARHRTGKGQYVDISMTDGVVGLLTVPLYFQQLLGISPERGNSPLAHRYACYNTYETADGRYMSIGAVEGRFWKVLCDTLGLPEYAPLQYDEGRKDEILEKVRSIFKTKTLAEWEQTLGELDICWGPVRNLKEVLQEPHLRAREMVVDQPDADGKPVPTLGIAVKLSETPGSLRTPPCGFGHSTASVLTELGYSDADIEDLEKKGVI